MTLVELFFSERCYKIAGQTVLYGDLYEAFISFLDPGDRLHWTKQKFGSDLPMECPKGRKRSDGQHYVGNVSLIRDAPAGPKLHLSAPEGTNGYKFLDGEVK